jgi:hypothetical protein
MSDDIKYEYKSVQAMRGLENRSIAKAEQEGGWKLYDQTQGTLRTTLKFRRVKPETFLSKAWGMFRGLEPAKQRVRGRSGHSPPTRCRRNRNRRNTGQGLHQCREQRQQAD